MAEDSVNLVGPGEGLPAVRLWPAETGALLLRKSHLILTAIGLVAAGVGYFLIGHRPSLGEAVAPHLGRGSRVLRVGGLPLSLDHRDDVEVLARPASEALRSALEGEGGPAVSEAMLAESVTHLLVSATASHRGTTSSGRPALPEESGSVIDQLQARQSVSGLRTTHLWREASLVVPNGSAMVPPSLGTLLAEVARRVLAGEPAPRSEFFPEPLRRRRSSEVMVMLRERGNARLWRSARGPSLATALTTAATVARNRWKERQVAMGGPIDEKLSSLDVEVVLLEDAGTLESRDVAFVNQAFTAKHGVGFEYRGAWKYRLAGERDASPVRAFEALFREHGLTADSFTRSDLRLYRLRSVPVGTSVAAGRRVPADD